MIEVVIAPAHLAGARVEEHIWRRHGVDLRLDRNHPVWERSALAVPLDDVRLARMPADALPRFRELLGAAPEPSDAAWAAAVIGADVDAQRSHR